MGTVPATRQMPASSPAGISFLLPHCPRFLSHHSTRQQTACPCRAGPLHNPVQSQPEHTRGGSRGCSSVGERKPSWGLEAKPPSPGCAALISSLWLSRCSTGTTGSTGGSVTAKQKKKANSVPLNPSRTEIIPSLHQPPRGSSCSPPGSAAGPPSLWWELQRGCQRKGSLYPLLEILYLPFQAEIPLIGRGLAACWVAHRVSVSSPKTHAVPLESERRAVGSPLPCDGAGCTSPALLSTSCIRAGY